MLRVGMGYDIHRLGSGPKLMLGGVEIPYPKGPLGHSDGDVLIHAIIDAMLGACTLAIARCSSASSPGGGRSSSRLVCATLVLHTQSL